MGDVIHDTLWNNISFTSSFATSALRVTPVTFTVTIASPAVFTATDHGLSAGDRVRLYTTGALPTNLSTDTVYFVISAGLTANDFELSTTLGGSAINTSGSQSGTHTYIVDETLDQNGRESDTSVGRRFKPSRESRFRTTFYIADGLSSSTNYITAPAISTQSTIGTTINDGDKSYVGIKIVNGAISLVSNVSGTETTIATGTTISDDSTNLLEINYYISHATVSFNDTIIGDISCNLLSESFITFFPFLTSIKSTDGTAVNLTMEAYEFLQKRK